MTSSSTTQRPRDVRVLESKQLTKILLVIFVGAAAYLAGTKFMSEALNDDALVLETYLDAAARDGRAIAGARLPGQTDERIAAEVGESVEGMAAEIGRTSKENVTVVVSGDTVTVSVETTAGTTSGTVRFEDGVPIVCAPSTPKAAGC